MSKWRVGFYLGIILLVIGAGYQYKQNELEINNDYEDADVLEYISQLAKSSEQQELYATKDSTTNMVYRFKTSKLMLLFNQNNFRLVEDKDGLFLVYYKSEYGWSSRLYQSQQISLVLREANELRSLYDKKSELSNKVLSKKK